MPFLRARHRATHTTEQRRRSNQFRRENILAANIKGKVGGNMTSERSRRLNSCRVLYTLGTCTFFDIFALFRLPPLCPVHLTMPAHMVVSPTIYLLFCVFSAYRYERDPRGNSKEKANVLSADIEDVFGLKVALIYFRTLQK